MVSCLFKKGEQMNEESAAFQESKPSAGSIFFKRILLIAAVIVAKSLIDELIYYAENKIGSRLSDAIFNPKKALKGPEPVRLSNSSPFSSQPQTQMSLYGNQNQTPTLYNPFTYK